MWRQIIIAWMALGFAAAPAVRSQDAAPGEAEAAAAAGRALTVDAMVGQIYGKPIYASQVFREIGEETLVRLGQTLPRLEFRSRAYSLIDQKLMEWLVDKLRIAEAYSVLNEREQQGLAGIRKIQREQLIAKHGGGVQAQAEKALMQKYGYGLDEMVERYIHSFVLARYREQKIMPRIDVNRREVERYYQDHFTEFNPPPSVTIRLIVTRDPSTADKVDAALAAGESFEDVARRHGEFRTADGGLLEPFQLKRSFQEFNELSWPALNQKVRTLSEGQHTERTSIDRAFYWAKVEKLQTAQPRPLEEVFLEIERKLLREKEERAQRKLLADLLARGNYTPARQMAEALLEVAMVRFARE